MGTQFQVSQILVVCGMLEAPQQILPARRYGHHQRQTEQRILTINKAEIYWFDLGLIVFTRLLQPRLHSAMIKGNPDKSLGITFNHLFTPQSPADSVLVTT